MSVINEMLRDLEKRRGPEDSPPVLAGLRATPVRHTQQAPSKWFALTPTIGVLLTTLLGFALIDRRMDERTVSLAAPAQLVPATPEPAAAERVASAPRAAAAISRDPSALIMEEALALLSEVPEEPLPAVAVAASEEPRSDARADVRPAVRLLGARLAQTDVGTRLTFELSGQTTHTVERDDKGRLQLVLRDTRLTEAPPRLPLGGTVLRSVHVSSREGDVRIELEPVTTVHAQSTMMADEESARLVLVLEPAADWTETQSEALPAAVDELAVLTEPTVAVPEVPATAAKAGSFSKTPVELTGMQTAERSYRRALDLIAGGVEEIALQALEEALAYEPAYVAAGATLAATLLRLGRVDEAKARLAASRAAAGNQPAFAKVGARILIQQGQPMEALAALIESPPDLRRDPEYHAMMAALYQRSGDHKRASALFKRLLTVRADRAAWWMGLGISLEGEGSPAEALVAYRNAGQLGGLGADSASFIHERIVALAPVAG